MASAAMASMSGLDLYRRANWRRRGWIIFSKRDGEDQYANYQRSLSKVDTILIEIMDEALFEAVDDADPEIFGSCFAVFKFGEQCNGIVEDNSIVGGYNSLDLSFIGRGVTPAES